MLQPCLPAIKSDINLIHVWRYVCDDSNLYCAGCHMHNFCQYFPASFPIVLTVDGTEIRRKKEEKTNFGNY